MTPEEVTNSIIPSHREFRSLLLAENRKLGRQPEATQKALDFLWRMAQLAPRDGPMDISLPSAELLELGLIPTETAERIKRADYNTLRISIDPENSNTFNLIEEYIKRRTHNILLDKTSPLSHLLIHETIRDTFKLEKLEGGKCELKLVNSCSPRRHVHILSEKKHLLPKDLKNVTNIPLMKNKTVPFPNKTIGPSDINRLLTICYRGLGGSLP
ncbi:MAG: hypothetical protein Q8Q24_02415 [bacterium]|nr:hypothetical protein [bacterium]